MQAELILVLSLGLILAGAEVFTNGVEWLGWKLKLCEGAIGSVLAAVGTALPETMIPVIAILFGTAASAEEIGIGAILGAPFMLATLAMFVTGLAVVFNCKKRPQFPCLTVDQRVMQRDLSFFLIVYTLAVLAAFLGSHQYKLIVAAVLVVAYGVYVWSTFRDVSGEQQAATSLRPCLLQRRNSNPPLRIIILQIGLALGAIVLGAGIFVEAVEHLSSKWGVAPFILALIIAPVATELPEKFNSIIWIGRGKDTLALGNITGAMVFQSSLIPALGIALTPWELSTRALLSVVIALASAGLIYGYIRVKGRLTANVLLLGGVFYLLFLVLIISGIVR